MRIAVITGASRGIGRQTAERAAHEGFDRVVLVARSADLLAAVAAAIGDAALPVTADVTREDDVLRVAREVRDRFGACDLLVNNAAAMVAGPIESYATGDLDLLLATNVRGPVLLMREFVPLLRGRERATIVNVASLAPTVANPGLGVYAATKAALIAAGDALREEVREDGIRVSAVLPGSTRTSLLGDEGSDRDWMLDPTDVARAILSVANAPAGALVSRIEVRPLRRKPRQHPARR